MKQRETIAHRRTEEANLCSVIQVETAHKRYVFSYYFALFTTVYTHSDRILILITIEPVLQEEIILHKVLLSH